jgi:23S rRNA (cytidine1920-2'-O)/16S rRNA (cytidine1409-2'-O)-methyltransferase
MARPTERSERIDRLLVDRGLAPSRERAQALVLAGLVVVDDRRVDKPGARVPVAAAVRLKGDDNPYVSRGGLKLAGALEPLGVDPAGRVVLDVGASTGGFTDCVLQRGAALVYALDVGHGQLAWKLQQDPRVVAVERTNARTWDGALPGGGHLRERPPDLVVIDASFISLRLLLPNLRALAPAAEVVALVKPQFEVGRGQVGKGGVVRDDGLRAAAVADVVAAAAGLGWRCLAVVDSPLPGPRGNREVFVRLAPLPGTPRAD